MGLLFFIVWLLFITMIFALIFTINFDFDEYSKMKEEEKNKLKKSK